MIEKKGNNYIIDNENGIAKIELQRRGEDSLWTIIDLEDLERILDFPFTWSAKYDLDLDQYYAESTIHKKRNGQRWCTSMKLHKFIMNVNGNKVVDHINHDTLDNTKENLRVISHSNNLMNRKSRNSNNKSGYRNVSWSNHDNKWIVQLQVNKKNTVLGRFPQDKLLEVAKFAEKKRKELYGEFAGHN